jgi:hydrogenase-1 operon protein HyaE
MTPLDRLLQRDHVITVDAAGAIAFAHEPAAGMLLLAGDLARAEVTDVAVVLSSLATSFPGLRVAVAHEAAEPELRASFQVSAFPSLLFVKDGAVVTKLARMQAWSTYEDAARALTLEVEAAS